MGDPMDSLTLWVPGVLSFANVATATAVRSACR